MAVFAKPMETEKEICKLRIAPSLGELDGDPNKAWNTEPYNPKTDKEKPMVQFGMYDLRDYLAVWRHSGRKWILWAGSDIVNFQRGFVFNDGKLKMLSQIFKGNFANLVRNIANDCENWVEDKDERDRLASMGIKSCVCPSFVGKIEDYPVCYKWEVRPQVYVSGHRNREGEYGFDFVEELAMLVPECDFHIYGADWQSQEENVICHGFVPKEQFNAEIKKYHCGLRLNLWDGFSEITAKSALMGQYPITRLEYPLIPNFKTIDELAKLLKSLPDMYEPNYVASEHYRLALNKYPWVK